MDVFGLDEDELMQWLPEAVKEADKYVDYVKRLNDAHSSRAYHGNTGERLR
jgi:hypothetical protein